MIKNRRMGRLKISLDLLNSWDEETVKREIMSKLIILKADILYDEGVIEYMALCNDFREVPSTEKCPAYNPIMLFTLNEDGTKTTKLQEWREVKDEFSAYRVMLEYAIGEQRKQILAQWMSDTLNKTQKREDGEV